MSSAPFRGLERMTQSNMHIGRVATVVVPVTDQDATLAFYVEVLGMEKVSDFTYPTGERWLEVSPAEGSSNLCLVSSRPERPAGIDTGVVLFSSDVLGDLAALRAQGFDADEQPLPEGEVEWWSGAPLAGVPTQGRLRDPDGNSFLLVATP
jgi:catechol 2,3-dioxygenase-like lactoylglutathione lyase family enzyme